MKCQTDQANSNIKRIHEVSSGFLTRQLGTALIISLVILIVLTMIGIGGMKRSMVQEKMAGISWDANAAFQATEITLREAENLILAMPNTTAFGPNPPLSSMTGSEFDPLNASLWNATNALSASSHYSMVENPPFFTIKHVRENIGSGGNNNIMVCGYEDACAGSSLNVFKITAYSAGRTDGARIILQTYFARRF